MEFWTYPDVGSHVRKYDATASRDKIYKDLIDEVRRKHDGGSELVCVLEYWWHTQNRPYYQVYPSIIKSLMTLDLSKVPVEYLKFPVEPILIRFSKDNTDCGGIRSVLVGCPRNIPNCGREKLATTDPAKHSDLIFCLSADFGEQEFGTSVKCYRRFFLIPGKTLGECEAQNQLSISPDFHMGQQISDESIKQFVRVAVGVALIASGKSELIQPDVLSADRDKYEKTQDQKYVDKAIRRGKFGWVIGRNVEMMPHFRRPHLALVWTGEGRKIPKIVMRKGSIVHREVVEKIPHGFQQDGSN